MADEEKQERGFTVVDRRGSRGGEPPPEAPEAAGAGGPEATGAELPAVDFATFALSLGTSALYHMGLVEHPEDGQRGETNLPLAQQTIDTLAMLQAKTRGNLDEQESQLLENLLYELRMRFVEAKK